MKFTTRLFILAATFVTLVYSIPTENRDETKSKNINWNDINLDSMDLNELKDTLKNIASNKTNGDKIGLENINWDNINLNNMDPNDLEEILKIIASNKSLNNETGLEKIDWNDINLDNVDPNDLGDIISNIARDNDFSSNNSTNITLDTNSDACENALDDYQECLIDNIEFQKGDVDYICSVYNSEKCQKLYNEGAVIIPECQKIDGVSKTFLDNMVKISQLSLSLKCSKDENGQYCPLNELALLNDSEEDGFITFKNESTLFDNALGNTCKSKKCTMTYTDALSEMRASEDEIISLLSLLDNIDIISMKEKRQIKDQDFDRENDKLLSQLEEYLKSSNCTQYFANVESGISRPSSIFRVIHALFISLGLLLFILI